MNVVIAPNLKKTSQLIDSAGNIIDRNGQILEPNVPQYVPTKEEIEAAIKLEAKKKEQPAEPVAEITSESPKKKKSKSLSTSPLQTQNKLSDIINKKVQEGIDKAVGTIQQQIEEGIAKALENL